MGAFTLGQGGGTGVYMYGQDLSAKHMIQWLEVDSKKAWNRIYQATNISNRFPWGPPVEQPLQGCSLPPLSQPIQHAPNRHV